MLPELTLAATTLGPVELEYVCAWARALRRNAKAMESDVRNTML
jgi:hypothetical protein